MPPAGQSNEAQHAILPIGPVASSNAIDHSSTGSNTLFEDPAANPAPAPNVNVYPLDQLRWAHLDFKPAVEPVELEPVSDADFARFFQQAGYMTGEGSPFTWPHQSQSQADQSGTGLS
jgi:hypothetical protein